MGDSHRPIFTTIFVHFRTGYKAIAVYFTQYHKNVVISQGLKGLRTVIIGITFLLLSLILSILSERILKFQLFSGKDCFAGQNRVF